MFHDNSEKDLLSIEVCGSGSLAGNIEAVVFAVSVFVVVEAALVSSSVLIRVVEEEDIAEE